MSEQENTMIVRKFFEATNDHDLNRNRELFADDYRSEAPGSPGPRTLEEGNAYVQGFFTAFPDLHFEVVRTIAQGDFVTANWRATGTHNGPLTTPSGNSIPPTGKKATTPGSTTYQFKDGKAVYAWIHWDMVTLLAQLGLMPDM
jgi:steroid delta-isomerase-like uncharacterized protein